MKTFFKAFSILLAASACCVSCLNSDLTLGGNLIPTGQTYTPYSTEFPLDDIDLKMLDSLSGYSNNHITVGAIREDEFGLTTRTAYLTLMPLADSLDLGKDPVCKAFHFASAMDTVSVAERDQAGILQTYRVFELDKKVDKDKDFNINGTIAHNGNLICKGLPIITGEDSLSFNFTEEYGQKYLDFLSGVKWKNLSFKDYMEALPGFCIKVDAPEGRGGRINTFNLQMDYNKDYSYLGGNYAKLSFNSEFDGKRKDTTMVLYFCPTSKMSTDTLFKMFSPGSYPQSCLNLAGNESQREKQGKAQEYITVEGGGGIRPKISAEYLVKKCKEAITEAGCNPDEAYIVKASLVFPFIFPDDYKDIYRYPEILSPTCRLRTDTTAVFMSLTDTSDENENRGKRDRSNLVYAPDITYHMQELLKMDRKGEHDKLHSGDYDIWFMTMKYETTITDTSDSDLADYYTQLAYQSYYQSMYGGYAGSYSDSYTNYYNYMMMAEYASNSTSTSTTLALDKDSFYCAKLFGPTHPNLSKRPKMSITFVIPNK